MFPLGATVNMDGSAIYYCVCVMHVSAMAGNALGLVEQLKVAMIGSLVTCGVAPIPGGFIVWIYMVFFLKDFFAGNMRDFASSFDVERSDSLFKKLLFCCRSCRPPTYNTTPCRRPH